MSGGSDVVAGELSGLENAVEKWVAAGDARPLERWLERTLDDSGVPRRLPVADWGRCLARIAEARERRSAEWPELIDARVEGLVRNVLRFSRPDGVPVFGHGGAPADMGRLLRGWCRRLADPGLETVVNWWFPARSAGREYAAPPLPAWSRVDRPLATLRANWSRDGDFIALDQRERGVPCAFELFGLGRTWLGPAWTSGSAVGAATPARPTCWVTNSTADLAEWAFREGTSRVVRSAALLRGRQLAVLAAQFEGPPSPRELGLAVPPGVTTEPVAESRAITLHSAKSRARVFPIALPRRPEGAEHGSLSSDDQALVLRQPAEARRTWLPLVVSWSPERNRRAAHWRTLTVSEKSKPCPPGVAFAARLSWGRDETLVVYRSLARPALRAFLGHQTRARYLVGLFTSEGKVEPLLKVDE